MSVMTFIVGLVLIVAGFVALVRKVHDRSIQETVAQLRYAHGDIAAGLSAFAGLLVPIVSSIATGLAFVVVGMLTRW
jgi:tetrahydromethanopterin S-methyltransferase subunit F